MSLDEFLEWLRSGRLGPCAVGGSRSDIIGWLGEPETYGTGRRGRTDRNLMAFRDFAFQAGLHDNKIVYYGLYFRRPSGAKFFAELGSEDGFCLDRSVSKDDLLGVVHDAGMELRDCGDRIELDSGVNMSFDDGALDSIQVSSPRVRCPSHPDGRRWQFHRRILE